MGQEVYAILKESVQSGGITEFTRKDFLSRLPERFNKYDGLNIRKRLYDVLNIFIAIKFIRKIRSKFAINQDAFLKPQEPELTLSRRNSKAQTQPQFKAVVKSFAKKHEEFLQLINHAVGL